MRVIVIGSGLSGTIFSKTLHELDPAAEVEIFGDERFLYYPRPNLIEYMAGALPRERLFPFSEKWFADRNIQFNRNARVIEVDPDARRVTLKQGARTGYDALLLATGAHCWVPPIAGLPKTGAFTLRTLEDAENLLERLEKTGKALIIGGGLLGLEIARALKARGGEVEIVEFFPRLLPRQLDQQGADILRSQIEGMGMRVRLGVVTEEILGGADVRGARLKDGTTLDTGLVVIAAGVRANTALAQDTGLKSDKGVLVDDAMRTSRPEIYAAGDLTEHAGRLYGIIPAAFEQAKIAAHNIAGRAQDYKGTVPSNSLKVAGLAVTSVGEINPEPGTREELRAARPEQGIYKKIVLHEGRLTGAIWMGTKQGVNDISRMVTRNADVEKWKNQLLDDDFDFSLLPG